MPLGTTAIIVSASVSVSVLVSASVERIIIAGRIMVHLHCLIPRLLPKNVCTTSGNLHWSRLSGYHADTPITIKAEASSKADSHPN